MIKNQDMELALGLNIEIDCFLDGIPRLCVPFKLKNLRKLTWYLTFINEDNLESNVKDEAKCVALVSLLKDSFPDYEIENILDNISNDNFKILLEDIKCASGLVNSLNQNDNNDNSEGLSWLKSVSVIQTYTSNTINDIKEMTLITYRGLLNCIGYKLNWEYKIETIANVKDPENYISKDEHPLSSDSVSKHYMTMADVQKMKGLGGK